MHWYILWSLLGVQGPVWVGRLGGDGLCFGCVYWYKGYCACDVATRPVGAIDPSEPWFLVNRVSISDARTASARTGNKIPSSWFRSYRYHDQT